MSTQAERGRPESLTATDRLVLALVRAWCRVAHRRLIERFVKQVKRRPDPATPSSTAEKFLWRKIFDHNPLFRIACDKLASKDYAQNICPELKVARTLWTGTDPDLIPPDLLKGNVVIKANNGSGWNRMVLGGSLDVEAMRAETRRWLSKPYGQDKGEWGYKQVPICLFVEEMLLEDGRPIGSEYKFHVSGGQTAYVFVKRGRFGDKQDLFVLDRDGQAYTVSIDGQSQRIQVSLPDSFPRMRAIAERLAEPFDYVRCDLYALNNEIYFSELTIYPSSGMGGVGNSELMDLQNRRWDLRKSWFLTTPQTGWRAAYSAALNRWLDGQC